jgi:hypothetical protein
MSGLSSLLEYFDLRPRAPTGQIANAKTRKEAHFTPPPGAPVKRSNTSVPPAPTPAAEPGAFHWLPQYIALVAGIAVQPYFQEYMVNHRFLTTWRATWQWFLASAIIGVMALPAVYRGTIDVRRPLVLQLCVIFTAGIGWNNIVRTGVELGGGKNASGIAAKSGASSPGP